MVSQFEGQSESSIRVKDIHIHTAGEKGKVVSSSDMTRDKITVTGEGREQEGKKSENKEWGR